MADSSRSEKPLEPCRACHDFKSWSKLRKKEMDKSTTDAEKPGDDKSDKEEIVNNPNCPLDRDELGRNTWGFLHTMAAYYPEKPSDKQKKEAVDFFTLFSHFYPCEICAQDLQKQIERFPPKTENQHELSQWLCRIHNRINLRLGKPQFDCTKVNERWKDGWADGSCD